jgi:hypothetical protein
MATTRQSIKQVLGERLRIESVRDVVLIGSASYAPELARDLDVVATAERLDEVRVALENALENTAKLPVDLILRQPGEEVGNLALAILAGEILAEGSETIKEARMSFNNAGGAQNSFKQAEACLRVADKNLAWVDEEADPRCTHRGPLLSRADDERLEQGRQSPSTPICRSVPRHDGDAAHPVRLRRQDSTGASSSRIRGVEGAGARLCGRAAGTRHGTDDAARAAKTAAAPRTRN